MTFKLFIIHLFSKGICNQIVNYAGERKSNVNDLDVADW